MCDVKKHEENILKIFTNIQIYLILTLIEKQTLQICYSFTEQKLKPFFLTTIPLPLYSTIEARN